MEEKNFNRDIKHWTQALIKKNNAVPDILSLQVHLLDQDVLFPDVVAATLANLFHYLIRHENGQCEPNLSAQIQQLFQYYPVTQQKLVQHILDSGSTLTVEHIAAQLCNITHFLDQPGRYWLIRQSLRIMFYRQWPDEQVREILDHFFGALQLDANQVLQAVWGAPDETGQLIRPVTGSTE
ncbi:hypothetical protein [Acinetobacter sp. A47]|uniref:hypothetical protein n=1 Tax=Acinetobacter sp. A47 TaxID=1561217 RepID=UPI00068A02BE|nr:hypothetical protein [Acinetobacter sp. A47]